MPNIPDERLRQLGPSTLHPLIVLQARAEARAALLRAAKLQSLEEATAPLFAFAESAGLVEWYGTRLIRAVILGPFRLVLQ